MKTVGFVKVSEVVFSTEEEARDCMKRCDYVYIRTIHAPDDTTGKSRALYLGYDYKGNIVICQGELK